MDAPPPAADAPPAPNSPPVADAPQGPGFIPHRFGLAGLVPLAFLREYPVGGRGEAFLREAPVGGRDGVIGGDHRQRLLRKPLAAVPAAPQISGSQRLFRDPIAAVTPSPEIGGCGGAPVIAAEALDAANQLVLLPPLQVHRPGGDGAGAGDGDGPVHLPLPLMVAAPRHDAAGPHGLVPHRQVNPAVDLWAEANTNYPDQKGKSVQHLDRKYKLPNDFVTVRSAVDAPPALDSPPIADAPQVREPPIDSHGEAFLHEPPVGGRGEAFHREPHVGGRGEAFHREPLVGGRGEALHREPLVHVRGMAFHREPPVGGRREAFLRDLHVPLLPLRGEGSLNRPDSKGRLPDRLEKRFISEDESINAKNRRLKKLYDDLVDQKSVIKEAESSRLQKEAQFHRKNYEKGFRKAEALRLEISKNGGLPVSKPKHLSKDPMC